MWAEAAPKCLHNASVTDLQTIDACNAAPMDPSAGKAAENLEACSNAAEAGSCVFENGRPIDPAALGCGCNPQGARGCSRDGTCLCAAVRLRFELPVHNSTARAFTSFVATLRRMKASAVSDGEQVVSGSMRVWRALDDGCSPTETRSCPARLYSPPRAQLTPSYGNKHSGNLVFRDVYYEKSPLSSLSSLSELSVSNSRSKPPASIPVTTRGSRATGRGGTGGLGGGLGGGSGGGATRSSSSSLSLPLSNPSSSDDVSPLPSLALATKPISESLSAGRKPTSESELSSPDEVKTLSSLSVLSVSEPNSRSRTENLESRSPGDCAPSELAASIAASNSCARFLRSWAIAHHIGLNTMLNTTVHARKLLANELQMMPAASAPPSPGHDSG